MIAALYVQRNGCYWNLPGVDPWDEARDARLYAGPHPVVAHPPCQLWVNMAAVNWKRYQRQRPAWYDGGTDYGCFASALASIRRWGGVLEHPASSHAWEHYGLCRPQPGRWLPGNAGGEWVCEVYQSAYGHSARKRTWLIYCGDKMPADARWDRPPGSHQIGWFDRSKPTLGKRAANATPPEFRDLLLSIARSARRQERAA